MGPREEIVFTLGHDGAFGDYFVYRWHKYKMLHHSTNSSWFGAEEADTCYDSNVSITLLYNVVDDPEERLDLMGTNDHFRKIADDMLARVVRKKSEMYSSAHPHNHGYWEDATSTMTVAINDAGGYV